MTRFTRTGWAAGAALAISALGAGAAGAGQIAVSTYSGPNGDTGAHHYWDAGYSNCPASSCVTDGAALSGGTGALTDGVIATDPAFLLSFPGEEVGWLSTSPTLVFNFTGAQTVNEVKLFVDNSHVGGITAPDAVLVNGVSFANPAWANASPPETIDIIGLNITADHISIKLQNPTYWVFASEIQFFNSGDANGGPGAGLRGGAPEPASWALMLVGFGGLGAALRASRRQRAAG